MVFSGRGMGRMGPPTVPPNRSMGGFMPQGQGRGLFSGGPTSGRGIQSMFGNRGPMPGGGLGSLRGMQAGAAQMPKRGLLSSLLNRGGSGIGAGSNLGSGVAGAASGGGGFQGVLNNMQQMVRLAQTATPMIQQYGPMVRNIPAMVKMAKALRDSDDVESGDTSDDDVEDSEELESVTNDDDEISEEDKEEELEEFLESEPSEKEKKSLKNKRKKKRRTKQPVKKHSNSSSSKKKESVPKLFI